MHRGFRWLSLVLGLGLLAIGGRWVTALPEPMFRYGFEWFLKLTPGETAFTWRYLVAGGLGSAALAWGIRPLLGGITARLARWDPDRVTRIVALLGAVLVLVIGEGVLQGQVVTDDEYAYRFQAGALLHGRAAYPAPAMPEFFTNVFVKAKDGRWFGQYPPGHPLMLVPGVAVGMPRLVPAVIIAINLLLTGAVFRRLAGPGWAAVGVTLLCLSPLFLLTGSTLLSHPTAYLGLVFGTWSALRAREGNGLRWGVATGLGIGLLFLARPWTGVTLGLFPAALLLEQAVRTRRSAPVVGGLAAAAGCLGLFLLYNWGTTGNPLITGYGAVRTPGMSEFGFAAIIPGIHDHTPGQGLVNAGLLAVRFHLWSLGWPVALVPAVFAFLSPRGPDGLGRSPAPGRAPAWGALAMLVVGLLSYVPYWSMGVNDTGPVKTYELLLPFGVLTTVGLRHWSSRTSRAAVGAWILASVSAAALVFWPGHLRHLRDVANHVAKPLRMIEEEAETPALVFVSSMQARPGASWVFGHPNARPDLADPVLYVRDLRERNMEYARLHPDRTPYRLIFEDAEPRLVRLERGAGR